MIHRAAAAEDGGALGSLCEVFLHLCASTAETWETARAQTCGVEFTGSLRKAPKHVVATPERRRAVLLCLTWLTSPPNSKLCPAVPVARNKEAFNSPTRRCPKSSRMQPKLWCSSRRSPRFLLLGRSCRQCRGRLLRAPGRLQKMQAEAPTCSCIGRSPTPKSP